MDNEKTQLVINEVREVLDKHGYTMQPAVTMNPQGATWTIEFITKESFKQ